MNHAELLESLSASRTFRAPASLASAPRQTVVPRWPAAQRSLQFRGKAFYRTQCFRRSRALRDPRDDPASIACDAVARAKVNRIPTAMYSLHQSRSSALLNQELRKIQRRGIGPLETFEHYNCGLHFGYSNRPT